ncbi:MAG: iron-containing alcohol dehydrogenase [Clostridiales bacterium]|nr:iron-containing alcohol dehydrogenase [Clostridiales bacterium]
MRQTCKLFVEKGKGIKVSFDFMMPNRILFGRGSFEKLRELLPQFGKRYMVLMSGSAMRNAALMQQLEAAVQAAGIETAMFNVAPGEPSPAAVNAAAEFCRLRGCDACLAVGGGSTLDTAKAAAALAVNGGSVEEYLEGVGTGRQIVRKPLAWIAVPTTAGTGAEATKNAVISDHKAGYKKSFRSNMLFASAVIVDPMLTLSVPPAVTAATGMDAITQLIESLTSKKSNEMARALCMYALRFANALPKAYANGTDIDAREKMCLCALYSGMALSCSGLGAAHGIAAGLGALLPVAHGTACALLLPHVMRYNLSVCGEDYAYAAECFGRERKAEEAIKAVEELNAAMAIPCRLSQLGVTQEMLPALARASMGSSMSGNPVDMNKEQCLAFLKHIF